MITSKMNVFTREMISGKQSLLRSVFGYGQVMQLCRTHRSSHSVETITNSLLKPKISKVIRYNPVGGTPLPETSFGQPTYLTHPHRLQEGELVPGMREAEFRARRHRLIDSIESFAKREDLNKKSHLIIVPSSCKKYMTEKIPYTFRQNSDFLYLTGCMEPDCVLALTSHGNGTYQSTLFLRDKDPHSELWDGPRTGTEQATKFFGVDRSLPITDLDAFLSYFAKDNKDCILWYDFNSDVHPEVHRTMKEFLTQTWNKAWESPRSFIHRLRLYKSPAEQQLMTKSCAIACNAIKSTIANSKPGDNEAHIYARVDFECRVNGAEYLAYVPVVAGGSRANIIHYINNDQTVNDGDMVLMDAGCECHGYCSDITRTWPISGKFSPAQRTLYEIVHSVQTDLIEMCNTFPSLDHLYSSMCRLLGTRLKNAGVMKTSLERKEDVARAVNAFCPHHVSHYLGMDVHDTGLITRSTPLEPGMVLTVEPGVYINANNKLANPEYHGLGIRIEDDILMTESGAVVLTSSCPKHPDDIEALMARQPADSCR